MIMHGRRSNLSPNCGLLAHPAGYTCSDWINSVAPTANLDIYLISILHRRTGGASEQYFSVC
jgi:hypothetical protein